MFKKQHKYRKALSAFFIFFILTGSNAYGFSIPERLEYDLTLAGITIGSLTLEAQDKNQDIQFISRITSQKWLSLFYEVDDTASSFLRKGQQKNIVKNFPFIPQKYHIQLHEGRNKIDKEYIFDQTKKNVFYIDHLDKNKTNYVIKDSTFDPLSSLYYLRRIPLQVGKSVSITIFNNQLIYKVEVQVLRKEALKTSLGTFNTLVIRTNMDSVGDGIFYLPGDIYIWLTDDEKKIPVLIEKRIKQLVEGKISDYVKERIPDYFMKKLTEGSVKATLVK